MADILRFPDLQRRRSSDVESVITKALQGIPKAEAEKIKFELVKTIDGYDAFFTEWSLTVPPDSDEALMKQIYDIAHQEHERKMRMLADIIKLKIKLLVAQYHQ